jgi:hypothetical protein
MLVLHGRAARTRAKVCRAAVIRRWLAGWHPCESTKAVRLVLLLNTRQGLEPR